MFSWQHGKIPLLWLVSLVWGILAPYVEQNSTLFAKGSSGFIRHVRRIETKELNISRPAGIAYSPRAKAFHILSGRMPDQPVPANADLILLTPTEKSKGSVRIAAQIKDAMNMTFDGKIGRLLILKTSVDQLTAVLAGSDGSLDSSALTRYDVGRFTLDHPQGMAVDPESGHLFILDAPGPVLVRVEPGSDNNFDNAVVSKLGLPTGVVNPRGLALDPTTGHLHLLSPATRQLFEVTQAGQLVAVRDLSEFHIRNPQGLVFAPSGDMTDDPGQMSLYIADSGRDTQRVQASSVSNSTRTNSDAIDVLGNPIRLPLIVGGAGPGENVRSADVATITTQQPGQIVELSFIQLSRVEAASNEATVVQIIDTSLFAPPSPDPAGIVHLTDLDTLFISDSEVNEMPQLFNCVNVFGMSRAGVLNFTSRTIDDSLNCSGYPDFSTEPTGVAFDSAGNGRLFFSDDNAKLVFEVNLGNDQLYGTADDALTSFETTAFNSFDPEGMTFDPIQGVLFIADGLNNEVYRVAPGTNGIFDGVPPAGDDQVTNFDTAEIGILDPEGIVYDSVSGYLYLVGNPVTSMVHVTTDGSLLRLIDISSALPVNPGGLAFAPGSLNPGMLNVYVADRGVDNDADPDENDGRVYELSVPSLTPGNTPPRVEAGPDQIVNLLDGTVLNGILTEDDTLPVAAVTTWSQVSGSGSVTFADASAVDTVAAFTLPGTYVLRLTANDGELAGSDAVTVTVTGEAAVSFLDVRITGTDPLNPAQSSDDAEEEDNALRSLTRFSTDLDMLFDRGVGITNKVMGLRFVTVTIPSAAFITNAFVQFQVDESSLATTSLMVQGEAGDDPVTFGFGDKISTRTPTTAEVSWSPPPWLTIGEAGSDQRTPNIAPIIQEIVARPGWSSGNSLVIMIGGAGERTAVAFEGGPAKAPSLHVEYQLPVPDVVGQSQTEAEAAIVAAGFTVGNITPQNSTTVPTGSVISQDPASGSTVAEHLPVNLVVALQLVPAPDVVGLSQVDARAALVAAGLTVGEVTIENSNTVPAGNVLSQHPIGGSQLALGSPINLVISQGPSLVKVPDVIGLSQTNAEAVIESVGLSMGTVTSANSGTVLAGNVISQDPEAGSTTPEGTPLNLVISLGSAPVTVPDVVGLSQAAADATVVAAGLTVGTITQQNNISVPEGEVMSQNPVGGSQTAPGTAVALVISLGPVRVPDVAGLVQADAENAIVAAGLTVGTVISASSNNVPAGDVMSQNPVGGSLVSQGTPVDVTISLGPAPVTVPDGVGLPQANAEEAIVAAGLKVGTVTSATSDDITAGEVISQNPVSGSQVTPGAAIDLVVSSGPVTAPVVVGLSQADALKTIVAANLMVGTVIIETSETVPSGAVISQNPVGGSYVAQGSAVDVVISRGPAPVTVPDVLDLPRANAEAAIVAAGLKVGRITQQNSLAVAVGKAISQTPIAGSAVPGGSTVDLVISLGPIIVPNIVGLSQADAEKAIVEAGLNIGTVTFANSNIVPAGVVISQNPTGGIQVAPGSAIDLVFSVGPAPVPQPDEGNTGNVPNLVPNVVKKLYLPIVREP